VQGVAGDERRMTIIEHLEELRRVLMISGIAWIVAAIAAFIFRGAILEFRLLLLTSSSVRCKRASTNTSCGIAEALHRLGPSVPLPWRLRRLPAS
jgi:Sec-independent protein secretion pathway component TatC